ncbi:hypothetical protein B0F90DRAFT_1690294 [Multifurca ochricompacta]|uniref:Uncharacterized protein n=1 Tax=Multifurca ochricompacta TaxID=376703 RepID=A0AAD4MC66_9AGAM|nr:hypothetical protein B0F90DRAFT_1690294 [Multifurca ochricompacta]
MVDRRLSGAVFPGGTAGRGRLSLLNSTRTGAGGEQMKLNHQHPHQLLDKFKRADDRPPRVPSPPVLPSLTQMAMAHTNGQDYGDYRSPTYSLYGLYS